MAVFTEFENENRYRNYPFAEHCTLEDTDGIPVDRELFVDAMIYPVNPTGKIYLSSINTSDKTLEVSDETGVILIGEISESRYVILHETEKPYRTCGTLVIGMPMSQFEAYTFLRTFSPEATEFCPSCVFPVSDGGVTQVTFGDTLVTGGARLLTSDNRIRPYIDKISDNNAELSFNINPRFKSVGVTSIKTIHVYADSKLFRVSKYNENTCLLTLGPLDKDDICLNAHREDNIDVRDTCEDPYTPPVPVPVPKVESHLVFHVASSGKNMFNIVVPNLTDYRNPLSVTIKDSDAKGNPPLLENMANSETISDELEKLTTTLTAGSSVVLQVPGVGGRD